MKNAILLLLLAALFTGCLDEIVLKNQRFDTKAVIIQGKLIQGSPAVVDVNIQSVGDFEGQELGSFIGGAKITLVGSNGTSIEVPEVTSKRTYQLSIPKNHLSFKVEAGVEYFLRVALADGRKYETVPETLLAVPDLEKMGFQQLELALPDKKGFISSATYLRFWVNSGLTAANALTKSKLRWELTGVYRFSDDVGKLCYNTEPQRLEKVFIYDGSTFNQERIDAFSLADVKLDFRFAQGFYLTIVQESLTSTAFMYWDQVKKLAERSGNMFEAPAAKIVSNIKSTSNPQEEVFGFFYATAQDTLRMYIRPEQVGSPTVYCPQPPTPRIGPTVCDNCLLQIGSTLVKPSFWIQ